MQLLILILFLVINPRDLMFENVTKTAKRPNKSFHKSMYVVNPVKSQQKIFTDTCVNGQEKKYTVF
jgi:hypothetical protein